MNTGIKSTVFAVFLLLVSYTTLWTIITMITIDNPIVHENTSLASQKQHQLIPAKKMRKTTANKSEKNSTVSPTSTTTSAAVASAVAATPFVAPVASPFVAPAAAPVTSSKKSKLKKSTKKGGNKKSKGQKSTSSPTSMDLVFTGFIRIPKTGSTTMARFLHLSPSLYSWLKFLSVVPYGYSPTTAHLGTNNNLDFFQTDDWFNCPHVSYPNIVEKWSKSLQLWSPPQKAIFAEDAKSGSFIFSLQAFTIVRDPFDRLISLFFYLRKNMVINNIVPLIDLTDAQYDRLIANDVSGWMELLHQECVLDGVCKKLGTFQYEYIDKDLNKAIELISGDGQHDGLPKIFTIVNECYEASLRLLTEAYEGLSDEYLDIFANSTHFHSNNNNKAYNGMDFGSLRTNAREWFKKDYAFYDAAVSQFKVYLTTSNIDRSHFADCMYWNDDDEDLMNTNEEVKERYISSVKIPVSIDSLVF